MDNWPEKPRAIHAHTALVCSCIYLKDNEAATAQFQLLTERYGESKKLPRVLNEIAESYCELKLYDQAEQTSQYVLDNYDYPQYEQCIWAQRGIIFCRLASGDRQGAKEATDALLGKFLTHLHAEQAIGDVADAYSSQRMYEQARELFKFNLDRYPNTNKTVWWIRGYVNHSAELGDDVSVNAGIEKLLAEFSSDENIPTVAYHIGEKLCSKDHPRAAELLQYVIDKHPDHEEALNARVRMGHIHIRRGEDRQAESIYNDIMSNYAQDPRLPQAIFLMAEGYWDKTFIESRRNRQMTDTAKESMQKALAKWETLITQFPDAPKTAQAHYLIGECCYRLGQYEKAIEYFQKTVDNFPDYENAWLAQNRIAKVYKFMLRDGIMPEREAVVAMTAAYEKLIANFPDCPAAKYANEWLGLYAISTEGGEK